MNTGMRKPWFLLALTLLLTVLFVPTVLAGSPSPAHPKYPYIVWDVSARKTVVVHVVNATPYSIDYKDSTFANAILSSTAYAQNYANNDPAIAFSPSGIPTKIPVKTGTSFVISWLDTGDNAERVLPTAYLNYTINNVDSSSMYTASGCTINPQKGNVRLLLNFDRVKETRSLSSDIYKLVLHTTSTLVDALELVAEPLNPLAWAGFATASQEAIEDIVEINKKNASSDQLFASAFIASYDDNMNSLPGIKSDYTDDTASNYDGIVTQQIAANGCPQSSLMVAVALLREKGADASTLNGNLPALLVVISTFQDWEAAVAASSNTSLQASKAGYQISQQLQREGKTGRKNLFKLVRTLGASDLHLLHSAYHSIRTHQTLSHEQEVLLERLAAALANHASTLPATPAVKNSGAATSGDKAPVRQTPVHHSR